MHNRLKKSIIRSLASTARAGLGAVAASGAGTPKRRRKRVKKGGGDDCTPCQAYAAVDEAHARVQNGSL